MTIKHIYTVLVVTVFLMACNSIFAREAMSKPPEVNYDSSTDQLTVKAENASLAGIYQRIAILSGVDIWMDPEAEQSITITFENQPLEQGLQLMGRKYMLNQALIYKSKSPSGTKTDLMVVAAKVLPEGKHSDKNLTQLIGPIREGIIRSQASQAMIDAKTKTLDMSIERWNVRMADMPEEKRKKYEAKIAKRLEDERKREEFKAEKKAERSKKKEKNLAKRQAREEQIQAEDPERYERMMQRKEARRQKFLEELKMQ